MVEVFLVNAFTEDLGCGNPAGVVLHDGSLSDDLMQRIALDLGKSETAFITRSDQAAPSEDKGTGSFRIRWFTPVREMPLCGHATLAASHVLFGRDPLCNALSFRHAAGTILAVQSEDGSIRMSFPLDPYDEVTIPAELPAFFGLNGALACIKGHSTGKVVLIVDSAVRIRDIMPDFAGLRAYSRFCTNGIGISQACGSGTTEGEDHAPIRNARTRAAEEEDGDNPPEILPRPDFISRYFNPWAGVDEDPVTGSVHTVLAGYWGAKLGKSMLLALQDSHRPGFLSLELASEQVFIGGKARIVLMGQLAN